MAEEVKKTGIIHSLADANDSYSSQHGEVYKFNIVVGADRGQCGVLDKEKIPYKQGDKVSYTIKETKQGSFWVSGIKKLDANGKEVDKYNNPEDVAGLIHTEAMKRSEELCLVISKLNQSALSLDIEVFIKSSKQFADFLGKEQQEKIDKNLVYQKNRILEVAIQLYDNDIAASPNKKDHKANVLAFAEAMWNEVISERENAKPKEKSK